MLEEKPIASIEAMQIFDSRGNPTVAVSMSDGVRVATASVPSGASTGTHEALELRDGGKAFRGKGVMKAVENVNRQIAYRLTGMQPSEQKAIDEYMISLDGTRNKSSLGANAILGVSMAAARLAAMQSGMPLFEYFSSLSGRKPSLPVPLLNIINGGVHAGGELSVQEFLIVPAGFSSFSEAFRCATETYQALKGELRKRFGAPSTNVGDEGGFVPPVSRTDEALLLISRAIEEAGYTAGKEVWLAIDAAASEFYHDGVYSIDGKKMSSGELEDHYAALLSSFKIISVEDPFEQESFDSFSSFTRRFGSRVQVIGDDLYVTNAERISKGIEMKASNAVLIKLNQIGTVSETLKSMLLTLSSGMAPVVSHRSGETTDSFIADMAVGTGAGQIKTGAPARGERLAKYNRLLEIELHHPALRFAGRGIFPESGT